jgi:hypothetical protein
MGCEHCAGNHDQNLLDEMRASVLGHLKSAGVRAK